MKTTSLLQWLFAHIKSMTKTKTPNQRKRRHQDPKQKATKMSWCYEQWATTPQQLGAISSSISAWMEPMPVQSAVAALDDVIWLGSCFQRTIIFYCKPMQSTRNNQWARDLYDCGAHKCMLMSRVFSYFELGSHFTWPHIMCIIIFIQLKCNKYYLSSWLTAQMVKYLFAMRCCSWSQIHALVLCTFHFCVGIFFSAFTLILRLIYLVLYCCCHWCCNVWKHLQRPKVQAII